MNRSILANLIDVYHLTIPEIYDLTDFQIREILFHPRKKTGELEKPKEEPKKEVKEEKLVVDEKIPKRSLRNPRYKEYFEAFTTLHDFHSYNWITEENYQAELKKIQTKFADLFDEKAPIVKEVAEDYQTNHDMLYKHYIGGLITKKQFDESVERLKQI